MADACLEGATEEKAQNEDSSSRESTDKDLQIIFKKLRVDNRPKRLQEKTRTRPQCKTKEDIALNPRRCVLKKPTFVYKSCHLKQNPKSKEPDSKRVAATELNADNVRPSSAEQTTSKQLKQEVKTTVELKDVTSGCGEQHRRAQHVRSCTDLNLDDTTPEELAAYFEQLLHIPKPMSAMAEMMYT